MTSAVAQDAAPPTPAPAAESTPLPPVTVETTAQPKKAAAKKKAKAKQQAPVATAPTQPVQPTPPSGARGAPGSGTGPVDGYAATNTTTGIKTDTPLREIPQSVSVVGQEQIRDQGAQTLQETVRYVPGVLADSFGFDSRADGAWVRGIPAAYYLDGLRTSYGYYVTSIPAEPYGLERVEVLRGPASVLYGQASTGGIINMVSKLPQEGAYNEIGFDYGSFDFKQVRFDTTGAVTTDKKWLYRFVGLVRDADTQVDYVENDRVFLAPSLTYRPTNNTSITVLGTYRDDHSGSVQQFLPHAGTLYPNAQGRRVDRDTFIGEPDDYYDTEQQAVTLFVDHKFSDALKLSHTSRFAHTKNVYDSHLAASTINSDQLAQVNAFAAAPFIPAYIANILGGGNGAGILPPALFDPNTAPFLDADQTLIPRLRYIKSTGTDVFNQDTNLTARFLTGEVSHKVLTGVDYMYYQTTGYSTPPLIDNWVTPFGQTPYDIYNPVPGNTSPVYIAPTVPGFVSPLFVERDADDVQYQTGLYIQDQIKWGPWIAVLGVRHDWLTMDKEFAETEREQQTSRRAGLMYQFDFGLTPYVSFTESFTPQPGQPVVDSIAAAVSGTGQVHSAKPLIGEQWEAGFKYQPDGAPFLINASVYELREQNQLYIPFNVGNSVQGVDVKARGFEIEATGQLTENIRLIAAYSYTDAVYEKHVLDVKEGTSVLGVPRHMASLWALYAVNDGFAKGLSFGAGVRYIGKSEDVGQRSVYDPNLPYSAIDTGLGFSLFGPVGTETFKVTTPSYTLFDAMIAYETEDWRWQLTGMNLEDKYYVAQCSARGDCGIGQARTIITGFTYKF